jgi:PAS domain S-box-containing protein
MKRFAKEYNVSDYFKTSISYSWQCNLATFKLLQIDPNCFDVLGYTDQDFLTDSTDWFSVIHPDDLPKFIENRKILKEVNSVNIDYRARHKDGDYVWLNNKYVVVHMSNPNDSIIVGITTDITEKKNAEIFFEHRIKLEAILSSTSASFVKLDYQNFDAHIDLVLEEIGLFAKTDRAYIFLYHDGLMSNTHEWVADGVSKEIDNLKDIPVDFFPWWNQKMQEDQIIYLNSLDELPPEASGEKEVLASQNIKSLLVVPLSYEDEIIGYMGFDAVNDAMHWSRHDLILLRTIAEITATAIKRREYADKLRESELRFRQMAESITEVFYLSDPNTDSILYISPAFEEVWGISAQLLYDRMPAFVESIVPEHRDGVIQMLEQQKLGVHTDVEYKILRPDGTHRWIRDRSFPIYDETNSVIRTSGIAEDVTRYKIKEEELRSSEEHYRSLIESSDAIIFMFDRDLRITFVNQVTLARFKVSYEEMMGKKIDDFIAPEDVEKYFGTLERVFQTNTPIILETDLTINGEKIHTRNSIVPIRDNNGDATHLLLNSLDITELFDAHRLINRSNDRLKGLQLVDRAIIQGGINEDPAELAAIRFLNQMVPCEEVNVLVFDEAKDVANVIARIIEGREYSDDNFTIPLDYFEDEHLILDKTYELDIRLLEESELVTRIRNCGYIKVLIVPMIVHGINSGILVLFSRSEIFFNSEYIDIAEEVATQIALSIYNKNLYQQIQKYSEELEINVAQRTKDIVLLSSTYKGIMSNTDISIIIVDDDGCLVECNPITYIKYGFDDITFPVGSDTEFIHNPEAKITMCNELLGDDGIQFKSSLEVFKYKIQSGFTNTFEWTYRSLQGQLIPVLLTVNQLKTENYTKKRYVLIASDITEQKKAENRLKETLNREIELGKFKSSFVTTASHQFRTPLTSIQSSIELINFYLKDIDFDKKDKTTHHIELINSEIKKFSELMSDILTIGKIEEGKIPSVFEMVDLREIIDDIIETYYKVRPDGRTVNVECKKCEDEKSCYVINVDKRLISHAILNLLSNAFKYSEGNPTIKISKTKEILNIEVKDNGIGIPASEINNLFQSFYRASNSTNFEGTGLGLAIVKEFVNINNGTISVKSKLNEGTSFTIHLK